VRVWLMMLCFAFIEVFNVGSSMGNWDDTMVDEENLFFEKNARSSDVMILIRFMQDNLVGYIKKHAFVSHGKNKCEQHDSYMYKEILDGNKRPHTL